MSRPPKPRFVKFNPGVVYFKPRAVPLSTLEEVELGIDELESIRLCEESLRGINRLGLEDEDNANWVFQTPNNGIKAQKEMIQSFIERLKVLENIEKSNSSLEELPNTQYFKDFQEVQNDIKLFKGGTYGDDINVILASIGFNFKKWMRKVKNTISYFIKILKKEIICSLSY